MPEQDICNLDPNLCLDCMRQPVEYKRMGAYVVPVCMKKVYMKLEDEFAILSAEVMGQRAEVLAQRENETPLTLRVLKDE